MTKPRILLAERLEKAAEQRLGAAADVVRAPSEDEQTLRGLIGDCDALVARTYTRVTRGVLEAGRRLRAVAIAGVGLDNVDVAAARELGITVLHTPGAATDAVADLTIEMMLLLLRPIPRLAALYRDGRFHEARAQPHGRELGELMVGIVGMGRIGSAVGRRLAAGFGSRVRYNDIATVGPFDFAAEPVSKEAIWADSDIVTLHVPLTEQTRGLVGADVLARLRPTAMLINTARGAVVDAGALAEALEVGRLAGAAMDVTCPEPLPPDHPLFRCDRCILTPHIAARTYGGWQRMCAVVDQLLALLGVALPR